MTGTIRKSIKYLVIFFGIIISLPTIMAFLLRMPSIQTMLVRRITDHVSEEFRSAISIGKVHFRFFNKLNLDDILIRDQNNDTLLFARKASAVIRKLDMKKNSVVLGRVGVENPVVSFITDSSGMLNLRWYLDKIIAPADTIKKQKNRIFINQLEIDSGSFSIVNMIRPESKTPIDLNNLHLSGINCILEDFSIQNDTTSFSIYSLEFAERTGFMVRRMNSEVAITRNHIMFNSAFMNADSSILNISHAGISADSSFRDFLNDVRLDIRMDRSLVYFSDLQYFAPFLDGIDESLWLSGRIIGTVAELRGRNIELSWKENTYLDCDFDLSGLPEIDNSFIYFGNKHSSLQRGGYQENKNTGQRSSNSA